MLFYNKSEKLSYKSQVFLLFKQKNKINIINLRDTYS